MKNIIIDSVFSFFTHKRGEEYSDIQDRLAVDKEKGRFALSDGVTQSALPQVWAQILVDEYLRAEKAEDFLTVNLSQKFQQARDVYASSLSERDFFNLEIVEDEFGSSSATFVGVDINDGKLSWHVIGDSCLFLLPDEGKTSCICSLPVEIDDQGRILLKRTSHPNQLSSDGTKVGEWICGEASIFTGWVLLMSDEMSSWFVEQINGGMKPLEQLLSINDNEQFEAFVENEYREKRLDSDDESVILIHLIEEKTAEGKGEDEDKIVEEVVNDKPDLQLDKHDVTTPKDNPNTSIPVENGMSADDGSLAVCQEQSSSMIEPQAIDNPNDTNIVKTEEEADNDTNQVNENEEAKKKL